MRLAMRHLCATLLFMREIRKVRLEIVPAAFLAAQRVTDLVHTAQVIHVVPLVSEDLTAVLANQL